MKKKLSKIKLLLLDVDGVLTDGTITYTDSGEQIKSFNSKDGLGLRLLMNTGIKVGIITGRKSKALKHRCKNLGINLLFEGEINKVRALEKIIDSYKIKAKNIAFAGDDLLDISIMKKVGMAFCVADANKYVKKNSDIITTNLGGKGAVREICEIILKNQGLWDNILKQYT